MVVFYIWKQHGVLSIQWVHWTGQSHTIVMYTRRQPLDNRIDICISVFTQPHKHDVIGLQRILANLCRQSLCTFTVDLVVFCCDDCVVVVDVVVVVGVIIFVVVVVEPMIATFLDAFSRWYSLGLFHFYLWKKYPYFYLSLFLLSLIF